MVTAQLLQFLHRVRINNMPDCDPFEPKEYNSFDKVSDLITRWAWNSIFVSNMEPQMFDAAKVRLFQLTKIESLDPAPPPASTSTALVIGPSAALAGKPPLGLVQPVANDGKPATLLRIAIQKLIQVDLGLQGWPLYPPPPSVISISLLNLGPPPPPL